MRLSTYLASAVLLLITAFGIFRLVVRRDYRRKGRLTPFASLLEWLIFAVWAYFTYVGLPSDWPASRVTPIIRVTAWIVFGGGAAITVMAVTGLGLRRAHGLEVNLVVQSGLYSVTRNPQIVGFALVVFGTAVLWPSWHTLGSVVLYAVIAHTMVLTEEEHLHDRHGEEYARYCTRVPRYLGVRRRSPTAAP